MNLKEELEQAVAQDQADAQLVIAKLREFTDAVDQLTQKIDDLTAAAVIDVDAVRGVITQLKSQHADITAALQTPADPVEPETPAASPAGSAGTGEASV